jgi:hypothetical protein
MAIFLDTNALPLESHLGSLRFSIIRAIAHQRNHTIFLPSLALEEAVARRQRNVETAARDLERALDRLRKLGVKVNTSPIQNAAEIAEQWRKDLTSQVSIIETPDAAFSQALLREIRRLRPAREGRGARDSAIWITVLEAHRNFNELSYFLSNNTKDFADPNDKSRLHPDLAAECSSTNYPLNYCASASDLLTQLGEKIVPSLSKDMLAEDEAVISAIIDYISRPAALQRLLFDFTPGGTAFVASRVEPKLRRLEGHEGYEVEGVSVIVAWTHWCMNFSLGVLTPYGNRAFAQELLPVQVEGDYQLWIRYHEDSGQKNEAEVVIADNVYGKVIG